jgi:hypothetical protein
MSKWPADNQAALIAFYGDPGKGEVGRQLVKVTPPFQMYYDGRPLKTISFHRKAAPALLAALNEIYEHYGRDQAVLDKLRISHCAGTYNPRKIRGSRTRWSNHAFGAAIDLDAEHNGFNTGHGSMPQPVIDAFKRQGARWGGDYRGRTDPMHFEFCQSVSPIYGFADLPEADADTDTPEPVNPAPDVAPDQHIDGMKPPLLKRVWTWLTGAGVSLAGFLYDYRIVVALTGAAILALLIVLWLFGKDAIKNWIAQQVNG